MANMLATGTARLQTLLQRHAATPITYWRGRKSVAFSATKGQTVFNDESEMGVLTIVSADYLFPVSLLQSLEVGQLVEPKAGDVIEESSGARFEVLATDGEPCFRYSDPDRTHLRVHTKQVSINAH